MRDIYETRVVLEQHAIREAIPRIDKEDPGDGRGGSREDAGYFDSGDEPAAFAEHERFHFTIYDPAGSAWTMHVIRQLWASAGRYLRLAASVRPAPDEFVAEHRAIYDAVTGRRRRFGYRASDREPAHDRAVSPETYEGCRIGWTDSPCMFDVVPPPRNFIRVTELWNQMQIDWAIASPFAMSSDAGAHAFAAGGNAIDAALATAVSLTVTLPDNCALGGDMIALLREPDGSVTTINASGPAAASVSAEQLRREHGARCRSSGPHPVTVPGILAGWEALWGLAANCPGRTPSLWASIRLVTDCRSRRR